MTKFNTVEFTKTLQAAGKLLIDTAEAKMFDKVELVKIVFCEKKLVAVAEV